MASLQGSISSEEKNSIDFGMLQSSNTQKSLQSRDAQSAATLQLNHLIPRPQLPSGRVISNQWKKCNSIQSYLRLTRWRQRDTKARFSVADNQIDMNCSSSWSCCFRLLVWPYPPNTFAEKGFLHPVSTHPQSFRFHLALSRRSNLPGLYSDLGLFLRGAASPSPASVRFSAH
jgi:hypothetical protein